MFEFYEALFTEQKNIKDKERFWVQVSSANTSTFYRNIILNSHLPNSFGTILFPQKSFKLVLAVYYHMSKSSSILEKYGAAWC